MLYEIQGRHAGTGKRVSAHVEADSPEAAVARAVRHGIRDAVVVGTGQAGAAPRTGASVGQAHAVAGGLRSPSSRHPGVAASGSAEAGPGAGVRPSGAMIALIAVGSAVVGAILVGVPLVFLGPSGEPPVRVVPLIPAPAEAAAPASEPERVPEPSVPPTPAPTAVVRAGAAGVHANHGQAATTPESATRPAEATPGPFLTPGERDFFLALGRSVAIDGVAHDSPPALDRLPAIAAAAPQPLRGRVERFLEQSMRTLPTQAEQAELALRMKRAQAATQAAVRRGMLGADARTVMSDIFREADIVGAWRLQREMLVRCIDAKHAVDGVTRDLVADIARRGPAAAGDDAGLTLALEGGGKDLMLRGAVGDTQLEGAVLLIEVKPRKTGGEWTIANGLAGMGLAAIGVDAIDDEAKAEGTLLAAAQEAKGQLSYLCIAVLPGMNPGARVEVSSRFPLSALSNAERVDALLLTPRGMTIIEGMPGLEVLKDQVEADRAAADAEREAARKRPPARKTPQQPADRPARRQKPSPNRERPGPDRP